MRLTGWIRAFAAKVFGGKSETSTMPEHKDLAPPSSDTEHNRVVFMPTNTEGPGIIDHFPDHSDDASTNAAFGLARGGLGVQRLYERRPLNIDKSKTMNVKNVKELMRELARLEEVGKEGNPGTKLESPSQIVVEGALFLCGLLTAGWWKRVPLDIVRSFGWNPHEEHGSQFDWKSPVQEWQFHGFGEWAPSWDFSWFLDKWNDDSDQSDPNRKKEKEHYFAQIGHGEGDEADALPVYMGKEHAKVVRNFVEIRRKADRNCIINVKINAIIAHRSHFPGYNDPGVDKNPGGWLNYCVWIDPAGPLDIIMTRPGEPELYSGYLWKCYTLESYMDRTLAVDDVFFIWVHTDFSKPKIVAFSTDLLDQQQVAMERHIRSEPRWNMKENDKFVLLAKSSWLLDGDPIWTEDEINAILNRDYVPQRRP